MNKKELIKNIIIFGIDNNYIFKTSPTDKIHDFSEEKKLNNEHINGDFLKNQKWVRFLNGEGEAIQINVKDIF